MESLVKTFREAPTVSGKPTLVMANTVKGKGVSFAENVPAWHHHVPSDEQLAIAHADLKACIEQLQQEGKVHHQ
ncbi:transketolase [compost metagenome]